MLKIGFWDEYLDNWHANYYPGFLREAIAGFGYDAAVTDAFAYTDLPGGTSAKDWCAERGIRCHTDPAAFLKAVDAIMVIGAVMPVCTTKSLYRRCRAGSRRSLIKPSRRTLHRERSCLRLHGRTERRSFPHRHSGIVRVSPRIRQNTENRGLFPRSVRIRLTIMRYTSLSRSSH